ncbi:hypothetical protein [Olleya sp. HaHaR_3_96]|uniref:hypothetical protein n=1 Tax=Olleya sp. HaHaR_3_96 TaxID=2745560 RepID=UPI001C4F9424|nr:hypothetical protein [Olleya sp. HaHaR_3_96]QXP60781.1 hypothetical protein H0I26_03850 [Olleya sp. HaHaR_3_96]
MKKILYLALFSFSFGAIAQSNDDLTKHYEAYYKQMKTQGDAQGIINAITHLNVLKPSEARKDTLAYIYLNEGKFNQALNTIGIEQKATDSDMALEVKAVSLKSLGNAEGSYPFFKTIYDKYQNAQVAYELAEINLNMNKLTEAKKYIDLGLANVKDNQGKSFYETQQPYKVPLKSAFYYLDALIKFNENKDTNKTAAVLLLDKALAIEPRFNMALLAKNALSPQEATDTEN